MVDQIWVFGQSQVERARYLVADKGTANGKGSFPGIQSLMRKSHKMNINLVLGQGDDQFRLKSGFRHDNPVSMACLLQKTSQQ